MDPLLKDLGLNIDWRFAFTFSGLVMARLIMVTTTIPFLVGKPVPANIKMGLTIVLLIFLYPYLAPADHSLLPKAPLALLLLFLKEAFYGLSIGITASIVFHAFESAGAVIDNQRGAAIARMLIPQLGEQSSIFGGFNFMLGIVIFISLNGHILFFKALFDSYDALPILTMPSRMPDMLAMSDEFIRMTGRVLLISLQLTAPILISIFVADVVLGIVSKAAPAMNVWEMGFAIRGILGVLMYFLALGLIGTEMGKMSMGVGDQVEKIVRFLSLTPG